MNTKTLPGLLELSSAAHSHLCPRQILGVRMGMYAGELLNLHLPQSDKRLLVIIETDGCFADGLSAATNATVGHRTLRVEDYGKTAAVFIDTKTERAIRVAPALNIRQQACEYVPEESRHYSAQMQAYQIMPDEVMFNTQEVMLTVSMQSILSRPGLRVNCDVCGEEIMNEREVKQNGLTLCRACAGNSYYHTPVCTPAHVMELYTVE
ncbi:MAG: formylmethanofuran dehydrogenase [Chloroflexi bacterium]|nr:formylmethanofuran dehydrogenase [Chloroflexota bacterium]